MSTMQIRGFWLFPVVLESIVRQHAPQLKRDLPLTVMMEKGIDFGQGGLYKGRPLFGGGVKWISTFEQLLS